jgi:DNA-directed RNA polymerase subunit beta'
MIKDFTALKITIASPQDIMSWSHGEVTKAETINYRTFKPEPQGLMAEEIFGPTKDFECYCGKYKKVRYKGIVCDRCGVEVTHKRVRRERMGHINLAAPVAHVWFSNGVPNKLALILDIPQKKLETVIYYARYIVTNVDEEQKKKALDSIESIKKQEMTELEAELQERIDEVQKGFEDEAEEIRKANKDKSKAEMQIERLRNNEKTEIARVKSAYKQRQDNLETKFIDLKSLTEDLRLGSTLSEDEYQLLESYDLYFYEAGMGAEAVKVLLGKIDISVEITKLEEELKVSKSQIKKSRIVQRLRILKGLSKSSVNPAWIILDILPVIPPDLRPIVQLPGGRFATYDLNDLYRRVINRNNRLKRLIALGAPEIILRNEKRMLQESVDSLLDNNHKPGTPSLNSRGLPFKSLSDMLRGKQGRFRQNLLGKRVDYSGNAVIVPGPELDFDQCGLPKSIALEIFRPFVIRELIARGYAPNPSRAKVIFEEKDDVVYDILEEVSKDRPVLLNRAPTLHRQSILAFYPVLIEGNAIRLHPMTCTGFNADFDGDQMAVHLPLSDKAVEEVKQRMFAKENMLNLRDGAPIVNVSKDMAFGIYFLTLIKGDQVNPHHMFASLDELISAYNLGNLEFQVPAKVLYQGKIMVTSAGRAIFNQALPEDYEYINRELNKNDISDLSAELFNKYGKDQAIQSLDKIKMLGFRYGGKFGFSISMNEFKFGGEALVKEELKKFDDMEESLINDYYSGLITENELKWIKRDTWVSQSEKIQEAVWSLAKKSSESLMDLQNSGAVSVSAWVKKISGVFGYVTDPSGNVVDLPVKNNFEKGFSNFEYFVAARGSRKSFADVALRTADSGYLTRRLHDVAQDVITISEDCGTTEGIELSKTEKRLQSFAHRMRGRVALEDIANTKTGEVIVKKGDVVTLELAKKIEADESITAFKLRSPIACKIAHGVCVKCYGYDNGTGEMVKLGEAVGTIASQALGEPTTQLTLKSKSDARAAKADVTQGLPRVEELFEARNPKAQALLAEIDGVVNVIEDKKKVVVRVTAEKPVTKKFELKEGYEIIVKNNSTVKEGDVIAVKEKKEIKSEMSGKLTIENGFITVTGTKHMEIEKETDNIVNVMVKDGDKVKKGDQMTFGSIDPKELGQLRSMYSAQKYIVQEVQDVYGIQGLEVDDRHLEIIARQMSRYGLVTESGESETFLSGDYADALDLDVENEKLAKDGKKPLKYNRVLLGITNSALRTESFLSAASFEQQVRVLTEAALVGKVDHLRGLKENVIIGRPVPLGVELLKKLGLYKEEVAIAEGVTEEDTAEVAATV